MLIFVIMKMEAKQREAFSKVVMGLLHAKNLSQRQVAMELDTSPSNFNQRIVAGSMRPGMIMQFNKLLGVDLLRLVYLYEQGENLITIIDHAGSDPMTPSGNESKPSTELHELIVAQSKAIKDLKDQLLELTSQLKIWMDQAPPKSNQN